MTILRTGGRSRHTTGHPTDVVGPRQLRRVLREVPTSLAVVCAMDGTRPVGATIGSFVSVSLDPPLVAWFAMRSSGTLDATRRSGAFSVNVLAENQGDLVEVFASSAPDRFLGVGWAPGPGGSPHLDGAVAVLDCVVDTTRTFGDHEMVVGRVTGATAARPERGPLVFARGGSHGLSSAESMVLLEVARPA